MGVMGTSEAQKWSTRAKGESKSMGIGFFFFFFLDLIEVS